MGTCLSTLQPTESLEVLLQKPQRARVKNILIRHIFSDQAETSANSLFLETSHILKYSPKYYKNLALQVKPQNRLLSKIKKIKKLKKFTGHCKDFLLPQKVWFNLLVNSRKDIEEIPEITCKEPLRTRLDKPFWNRLNSKKIQFFYNVKAISEWNRIAVLKESFVKHLLGMRKLETLKISVRDETYDETKLMIKELNRMDRFLCRLGTLGIDFQVLQKNHQELAQYKVFFSYVTAICIESKFDPIYTDILQMSKNLKSFSFAFFNNIDEFVYVNFLKSLQPLSQLKELGFHWPNNVRDFWSYFKHQSSLRYLSLRFSGFDLMNESLFRDNSETKDVVGHWKDLKELEVLQLSVSYSKPQELQNIKKFIGLILQKAHKLRFLKLWIQDYFKKSESSSKYESFIIEDMSHLYESLEVFEYHLSGWNNSYFAKLDLGLMKPFQNLKKLKLQGTYISCENVEEAVCLLEENQKEGETSVLEIKIKGIFEQDWLGESLKKIEKIKRKDRDLKLIFNLTFGTNNTLKLLEKLCKNIKAVKTIKGLEICLVFEYHESFSESPIEKVRKVLSKYRGRRVLRVLFDGIFGKLECIKVGEKMHYFWNNQPLQP